MNNNKVNYKYYSVNLSESHQKKLEECSTVLGVTKSEAIRISVDTVYGLINKRKTKNK